MLKLTKSTKQKWMIGLWINLAVSVVILLGIGTKVVVMGTTEPSIKISYTWASLIANILVSVVGILIIKFWKRR